MNTATDDRNVIDYYKYWNEDAIKASLDKIRFDFIVAIENFDKDFNISTTIRNCNAFTGKEIWILGRRRWDRRGAVGTHHYVRMLHAGTHARLVEGLETLKAETGQELHLVAVDNISRARAIDSYAWPKEKHVVMIFGQEQVGVPQELLDMAHECVYIRQYGSVRSLNVGTASGIVMYDYCAKVL